MKTRVGFPVPVIPHQPVSIFRNKVVKPVEVNPQIAVGGKI